MASLITTFVRADFETMFNEVIHLEDTINDWIAREEKDLEVVVQIAYLTRVRVWEGVVEVIDAKKTR